MEINRNEIPIPIGFNKAKKIKSDITATASKYPQGYFKEKPCRWCETTFLPKAPSEHYCSDNCSAQGLADAYIHREYNISLEDYRDLYIKQNGKCYICNADGFTISDRSAVSLVIDHDHATNKVRGLLCHNCNRALGLLKDDINYIEKAKEYLLKEDIVFESTHNRDRIKRIRDSRRKNIPDEVVVKVLIDWFDNKMRTMEIANKYEITKETVKSITSKRSREHAWSLYESQRAETIPSGSTSQANGDGKSLPITDNADGDNIVRSI
jgi:hypothetical protein